VLKSVWGQVGFPFLSQSLSALNHLRRWQPLLIHEELQCILPEPSSSLSEAYRILKPAGSLILAIIDKDTELGRTYEAMKASNKFYREATFYTTREVLALLRQVGFARIVACQTIFSNPETMNAPDNVRDGYGEGAFVVLSATKINQGKIE